jgi:membrane protein YdbS with pleckstrin-like domain
LKIKDKKMASESKSENKGRGLRGETGRVGGHKLSVELDGISETEARGSVKEGARGANVGVKVKLADKSGLGVEKSMEERRKLTEKHEKAVAEVEQVLGKEEVEKRRSTNGVFSVLPTDVRFETQDEDEEIVLLLRKHWFTNVRWAVICLVLLVIPVTFWLLPIWPLWAGINYKVMLTMLWYLLISAYIVESYLGWLFNIYIVTTDRIVDIDFYNILHREISDAEIDKIQDVTVKTGGFAATMFNYADILIQTAAEKAVFEFYSVPQAGKVARILRDLAEVAESEANK